MITKNEIPILEYDDKSAEVISPNHDCEDLKLPEKCLFAFLGDVVHQYAKEKNADYIVMGSHGRSGIYDIVIGSLTKEITKSSHIPVLVIPIRD